VRWLATLALLVGALGPAAAATLPDPGAPEAAERVGGRDRSPETYAVPTGPADGQGPQTQEVTGHVVWSGFRLEDEGATTAAVTQGYRDRLTGMGFAPVLDCAGDACGGFGFRFGVSLLPAPAMLMDVVDFAQLTMKREQAGDAGPVWVSVLVSSVLDVIHIQTVVAQRTADPETPEIEQAPTPPESAAEPSLPDRIGALEARLRANGHVAVRDLNFDTGGSRISPESHEALDALARMLVGNADLAVMIVGHSDNQGDLAINLELSERRAQAVRDALIARGVPSGQVEAYGVGFLAPIASNADERGRSLNRRVELVLR
jgi:OOP family OmpA-OmpF porin